jgi:DNA-binding response OmpR family regulator
MPRSSTRYRLARAPRSSARRGTVTVGDEHPRKRRVLVITDNEHSAKLLGDAFEANSYEILATNDISEAIRFTTTLDPGFILLMCSSFAATCDAARQIKPRTSATIIAFSTTPVTAAERNVALQNGCDDYRDAFLRINKRG